jgi:hypothetical protein
MEQRSCSVQGCGKHPTSRGMCYMHYNRWKRGDRGNRLTRPAFRTSSDEERFWAKVTKDGPVPASRPDLGPCWVWTAGKRWNGYGHFNFNRAGQPPSTVAHKFAYETLVGPVPDGLQLDHLCRVRHCVNPAHLEPVPQVVNIFRGEAFSAQNRRKTHCSKGHPFDGANTAWRQRHDGRWHRRCKTCHRAAQRALKARKRGTASGPSTAT